MLAPLLLVAMTIRSVGDCPVALEVERQLGPLLGDVTAARDVATIAPAADGSVSLSLADPTRQLIGARSLPPARTCDEQAKAVAVTLAVWEAQLHPEIALALDRLASAEPPPGRLEDPVVARVAAIGPTAPSPELAIGLGAAANLQSRAWAPGVRVELGLGPAGARWRGRLALAGVGRHQIDLPPGTVSWWRTFVQLGAEVDVARGHRFAIAVGAGALGGLASISGSGFSVNRATHSLELGGEVRARAEAHLGPKGHFRPWLAGMVEGWARRQDLDIEGISTSEALPRVEPVVALGADLVW